MIGDFIVVSFLMWAVLFAFSWWHHARLLELEKEHKSKDDRERIADEAERKLPKRRIINPSVYLEFSKPGNPLTQAEIDRIRSEWEKDFGGWGSMTSFPMKDVGITVPSEDKL